MYMYWQLSRTSILRVLCISSDKKGLNRLSSATEEHIPLLGTLLKDHVVHIYIHIYMHTYMHTYINAYIHTYIQYGVHS